MVLTNGGMAARVVHAMGSRQAAQLAARNLNQTMKMAIRNTALAAQQRLPEVVGQHATPASVPSQVKEMIVDKLVKTLA